MDMRVAITNALCMEACRVPGYLGGLGWRPNTLPLHSPNGLECHPRSTQIVARIETPPKGRSTGDELRNRMTEIPKTCRYCGARLRKWRVPEGAAWDEEFFYVCFNDDCSYYRSGWEWMEKQYSHRASYRYMINPRNGNASPLPVWSDSAMREMIVEDDTGEEE